MNANGAKLPDFVIVGAMKCATSTLHDQLAEQPGIHMSTPKEPNFFSNDDIYARGMPWYSSLFLDDPAVLQGESSTHYTKLPTYPQTLARMIEHGLGSAKLIYVVREPISRLVSQYIHEWSQGLVREDINRAIHSLPILVDYSRYNMQYQGLLEYYPAEQIKVVFYERLIGEPQRTLEEICQFLQYPGTPRWNFELDAQNVSSQRVRKFPLYSVVVDSAPAAFLRRTLIPKSFREKVRSSLTMKQRPQLNEQSRKYLADVFDEDLRRFGQALGLPLSLASYKDVANPVLAAAQ